VVLKVVRKVRVVYNKSFLVIRDVLHIIRREKKISWLPFST